MKRRKFLQRIGSILGALGVTEASWLTLGNRYYQALAEPSPRKFALLVGINQYSQSPALAGCLTDVILQRELLIHRFGFQPSDILSLTDEQATREFVERAFFDHLIKQVRPNDLVVFHFSGYGSRVKMENALVPVDGVSNLLLLNTLLLLLRSLPTHRVTAILDTSYHAPSTLLPVGWQPRVLETPQEAEISIGEIEFQKQLQEKATVEQSAIVLSATSDPKQLAREVKFSGINAGIFTYCLTQYLWSVTPAKTIQINLSLIAGSMQHLGNKQQPGLLISKKNQQQADLNENLIQQSQIGAEGVITEIEEDGKTVHLWLGGIPIKLLEYYQENSRFTIVSSKEQLVLRSRTGLAAKAQYHNINHVLPQVGQLVQEAVRVLPRNINLTVALDARLERIERVDATSSFAAISHVSSVITPEQGADYLFGKLPEKNNNLTAANQYGLFTLGSELIPNTLGEPGEAAKVAVQRLSPKLQTLLAAKLWRLTTNQTSSSLAVKANLETINSLSSRVVMQRETTRTINSENEIGHNTIVPVGSRIQYRIENQSSRPLYLMLLGLDSSKNAIALYHWHTSSDTTDTKPTLLDVMISPGETRLVPQTIPGFEWVVQGPSCWCETQLIFSTAPFTQTLIALQNVKYPGTQLQRISPLTNSLQVVQAILEDLHHASIIQNEMSSSDNYILNVNNWASLSFIYQVV